MAKVIAPGTPRYRPAQDETPPVDRRLKRIGTRVQEDPPPMRPWTAWDVASPESHSGPQSNDALIRRDGVPQYLVQNYYPAGKPVNNWTAAGPARPTLWTARGHTTTPRSGVSQSRFFTNPLDPNIGLHTAVANNASGAIGSAQRYLDPEVPQQRGRRQNRLSPALYEGQSYSQTTKVQGAR